MRPRVVSAAEWVAARKEPQAADEIVTPIEYNFDKYPEDGHDQQSE